MNLNKVSHCCPFVSFSAPVVWINAIEYVAIEEHFYHDLSNKTENALTESRINVAVEISTKN